MAEDLELLICEVRGEGPSPKFVAELRQQIVAETTPSVDASRHDRTVELNVLRTPEAFDAAERSHHGGRDELLVPGEPGVTDFDDDGLLGVGERFSPRSVLGRVTLVAAAIFVVLGASVLALTQNSSQETTSEAAGAGQRSKEAVDDSEEDTLVVEVEAGDSSSGSSTSRPTGAAVATDSAARSGTIVVNADGSVTMTWQEVPEAEGYSLYRDGKWIAGNPQITRSDNTVTYTDTTTERGSTYSYNILWRSKDKPTTFTTVVEKSVTIPTQNAASDGADNDDAATDRKDAPAHSKFTDTDGMTNLSDQGVLDTRGLKAFPGAEGGGQDSDGGRGGQLVVVNTTECSNSAGDGKISWKEAFQGTGDVKPGNRTIVFDVGGLFDCGRNTNDAFIRGEGEMTVACQTAPWPGVNLAAYRVSYKAEKNIIMRGCQFLNHDISGDSASMFRVVTTGSSSDIILDRVTGLHGPDDFTMAWIAPTNKTDTMTNITLSNSIIAEGDAYSTHTKATPATGNQNRYEHSHGAGCSMATGATGRRIMNCSFIGNLFAHNNRRNPQYIGASGHVIGNMAYNIGETGPMVIQRGAPEIDVWFTDNFIKYGPNTKSGVEGDGITLRTRNNGTDRVRMENNRYQLANNGKINDFADRLDSPENQNLTFHTPRDWTASDAFDCVGAKHRDKNTDRIIQEVVSATGEIGIGTYGDPLKNDGDAGRHWLRSEGGDPNYYPSTSHPTNYDTDNDGMPDAWEKANGLNVGTKDHNDDLDRDGYTNIEEFVNSLLRCK